MLDATTTTITQLEKDNTKRQQSSEIESEENILESNPLFSVASLIETKGRRKRSKIHGEHWEWIVKELDKLRTFDNSDLKTS